MTTQYKLGEIYFDIPDDQHDDTIDRVLDQYRRTKDVMEKDMLVCQLEAILKERGVL